MGTRISYEQVQKRLEGTGIKLVLYSGLSSKKSTFECRNGHQWETLAHVVTNLKCGCPTCAGNLKISRNDADERLAKKKIKILEWEGKTISKAKFKCEICEHEWVANMGTVLTQTGCKKCAGLVKKTHEEVNSELEHKNITCIDYCGSSSGISKFKCKSCNNEWKTTYSSIRDGRGCSKCASHGFSTGKKSVIYVFELSDMTHGEFIGFGITNNYRSRITSHRVVCKKHSVTLKEIAKFNFDDGNEALKTERKLKEIAKKSGFSCSIPGFVTESLPLDYFKETIRLISESM